jgi:hypothetical protein
VKNTDGYFFAAGSHRFGKPNTASPFGASLATN